MSSQHHLISTTKNSCRVQILLMLVQHEVRCRYSLEEFEPVALLGDPEDLADAADFLGAEDQHRDNGYGDEEALHGVRPDHRLQAALDITMRGEDFSNNQQS